jgi:hypothetical protein
MHQRSSGSCPYNKGNSYTCMRWWTYFPFLPTLPGLDAGVKVQMP